MMGKMGPLQQIMKMLPGMGKLPKDDKMTGRPSKGTL